MAPLPGRGPSSGSEEEGMNPCHLKMACKAIGAVKVVERARWADLRTDHSDAARAAALIPRLANVARFRRARVSLKEKCAAEHAFIDGAPESYA